jgi:hypothetical protein
MTSSSPAKTPKALAVLLGVAFLSAAPASVQLVRWDGVPDIRSAPVLRIASRLRSLSIVGSHCFHVWWCPKSMTTNGNTALAAGVTDVSGNPRRTHKKTAARSTKRGPGRRSL